jgi:O-antigen/teichoic acid export membrane protein
MTLTRLLDSNAYGIVGIITSVSVMLTLISDVGLYDFIVQHREGDEKKFRDQIWTIQVTRSIGLTVVLALLSWPIAYLLDKPELAPVLAVWSLSYLLTGLASLQFALAVRHKQFWRLSLLELIANIITLVVSVAVAVAIRSYWAIIVGMLAGALFKMVLSYTMFPGSRQRWHFDMPRSRELWKFSRYIAMSSALTLLIMQSDKLVLARLMPLSAYGLYAIATTLAAAPAQLGQPYSTRVLLSAYSEAARRSKDELARIFYSRRRTAALLYMFAVGGMIGAAPLIVRLLYDPRYAGVTPLLQLLLISVALKLTNYAAKWALIALGHTRGTFYANLCAAVWLFSGGAIAIALHNILLLVAVVGTSEIPAMLCYWWNLRRDGLFNLREELYGLALCPLGAAIGYGVSAAATMLFPAL